MDIQTAPTIYIAGDSTAASKPAEAILFFFEFIFAKHLYFLLKGVKFTYGGVLMTKKIIFLSITVLIFCSFAAFAQADDPPPKDSEEPGFTIALGLTLGYDSFGPGSSLPLCRRQL